MVGYVVALLPNLYTPVLERLPPQTLFYKLHVPKVLSNQITTQ